MDRARPPNDITPAGFFTEWVPQAVAADAERRRRLGDTDATIEFIVESDGEDAGGVFALRVRDGAVEGRAGRPLRPDLRVRVDIATWRALNRGEIGAPEALLRRRVHLEGDFLLGLKLHLILG